jgi:hypothetical protein
LLSRLAHPMGGTRVEFIEGYRGHRTERWSICCVGAIFQIVGRGAVGAGTRTQKRPQPLARSTWGVYCAKDFAGD